MLQWSKMLLSLVVVAVCCQQLVHAWHTSSPRPTASFHRNMHMTLSQQKTNVWKKWILTSAVAVGFTASDLSWTGLAPSPVAHAAAVTASKKTNTAATTTTTTASSSASTTVIKTADELALENSIAKQESGKKRANDLNEEVKAANNKINAIRNDLKKLDTSLSKVTSQLRKSGIDESTKARLTEEKTDLEKTISDVSVIAWIMLLQLPCCLFVCMCNIETIAMQTCRKIY